MNADDLGLEPPAPTFEDVERAGFPHLRQDVEVEGDEQGHEFRYIPEPTILEDAERLTSGDRDGTYGHPAVDYGRTALIFSAILGVSVTAEQAILCMIGVKMSRLCHTPDHRDSVVDIAGYARCYERVLERRSGG